MEYLFFGCGIIYFIIAAVIILGVALIQFVTTVSVSTKLMADDIKKNLNENKKG